MSTLPLLGKSLPLAALALASLFAVIAVDLSQAQQRNQNNNQGDGGLLAPPHRGPAIGGTSLTLRDIWGPAKMPPPPTDFGPNFDYQGSYNLNGAPSRSPYPN